MFKKLLMAKRIKKRVIRHQFEAQIPKISDKIRSLYQRITQKTSTLVNPIGYSSIGNYGTDLDGRQR